MYPTLTAVALSRTDRGEALLGNRFYRQTNQQFDGIFELNYTVFDFGARASRISAAQANLLAADFAFNDVHRKIIFQVQQAYYRVLSVLGQEDAVRASLTNAQTVQQAAEDRLKQGLATLPDLLEARSATAQAQYDLQAITGAEEIARGDLATSLGSMPSIVIQVTPLPDAPAPDSISDTAAQAIARAFEQRPDLLQREAAVRSADEALREARAAYYPKLTLSASPEAQSLYGLQQTLPWAHTAGLTGGAALRLNWTVSDGGARRNAVKEEEARVRESEAQANTVRDQIAEGVWTAYANLKTAFRQRQAASALLEAANQSYAAALESYGYGVRNLLDVTAAQRTLAQARSADVLARTQVLSALSDLAFQAGDSIQATARKP